IRRVASLPRTFRSYIPSTKWRPRSFSNSTISYPLATSMPLPSPRRPDLSATGGLMKAAGVLAGIAGVAAIAGVVWFNIAHPPIEVDKDTLCPKAGPASTTVVLIDVSDPLMPIAQEDVTNDIDSAVESVPKFGLLEL